MVTSEATVAVELGFMPASQAIADEDHPGLLRAGPRASAPYGGESVEMHSCTAVDGTQADTLPPDLLELGFDTVDLSGLDALQRTCAGVREAGHITDADAATIRSALDGAQLRCADGLALQVLHVADEGLILRQAGPNGLSVVGPRSQGMNGHGGATSIHADQDVTGTPLRQLMDGRAPSLFRHDSPDGHNHDAELMLVNLWIPLQQVTQPLVLADGRSIDRRRHQLRYGLATDSFLERDDDLLINDIWTFLHDPDQRWYLRSDMDHRQAYVFNTLSTPHGSSTLPGEDVAERCYLALEAAEAAAEGGDLAALTDALAPLADVGPPAAAPPALRAAIDAMGAVIDEARQGPEAVTGAGAEEWVARASAARRRVVRMSVELRMVVSISPSRTEGA